MPPPHHRSRANLVELRALVVNRIGLERSELYFHYVNRFLSLKLVKAEFDKLCMKVLGEEDLRLHKELIRAILRNACGRNACGDVLQLPSPRTSTGIPRYRNGIVNASTGQLADEDDRAIYENGTFGVHNLVQHCLESVKGISLTSRNQKKLQNSGYEAYKRSQMKAMLGNPFFPFMHFEKFLSHKSQIVLSISFLFHPNTRSGDRAWKTFMGGSYYWCSCSTGLPDSYTLRDQIQHFASAQGLEAVFMECANLLNKGLDVYLSRLLQSCFEVMGARNRGGLMVDGLHAHLSNQQTQLQNNGRPLDNKKADRSHSRKHCWTLMYQWSKILNILAMTGRFSWRNYALALSTGKVTEVLKNSILHVDFFDQKYFNILDR